MTPPTPTGVAAPQAGTEKRFMLAGVGGVVVAACGTRRSAGARARFCAI